MAVDKLSSRTSLRDAVIGLVAVARGGLAEVVGRAANPCIALVPGIANLAVVLTEIRYMGQLIVEISLDLG